MIARKHRKKNGAKIPEKKDLQGGKGVFTSSVCLPGIQNPGFNLLNGYSVS